ncbi:MAG TPA: RDD family protein [Hyphomicrobiales bacterium]|nr:RDD family protein [Hyphomicrobiales bacterium]
MNTDTPTAGIPAAVPLLAPLWRRLAAIVYDSFLIFAIWIIVGFVVLSAFGIEQARTLEGETVVLDPLYQWVLFGSMLLSALLFFGWFWTHSGQTLGMQAWRVKLENLEGGPLTWKQVLLRCLSAPLSLLAGGIGYWWALFDPQKRSWPDMLSHTRVVRCEL